MTGNVTVEMGQILVADIAIVRSTKDLMIVEADLHSKYVAVGWYGGSPEGGVSVGLVKGEYTLKADPGTVMGTVITLPAHTRGWDVEAFASRYTVRIIAWKPPRRLRPAWRETEEQYEHAKRVMDAEAEARSPEMKEG